jgi:two-component system, LytTR family, response regulator
MKLNCIIIEDEPPAAEKLKTFVSRVPYLKFEGAFENALDALNYIREKPPDIVFLDIQMEHLTGIQMLECMPLKPYIIITSAYSEYALKGYELQVFDYLLKPYSFERFLQAVNKVCADAQSKRNTQEQKKQLFVKTDYRIENICVDDIMYIEGMQAYLRIVLPCRKIMTKSSFKTLLDQLPDKKFIQVHKSWAINISKIDSIERNRIKIGDHLIPIGDTFREEFLKIINP